ncbi:MAG: hypothetical protein ACLUJF_06835 [Ruminococcus sp.]
MEQLSAPEHGKHLKYHRDISREPRHAVRVGSLCLEQLSVPEHSKPLFLVRVGSLIKKHLHIPEHG